MWEQHVERTKKKVLLRNFYQIEIPNFSKKEKIIFKVTKWTLDNAAHIIFSTDWQRKIFINAYGLSENKTSVVENYYGPKESDNDFESKIFVASVRNLVWKNLDILKKVFDKMRVKHAEISLFTDNLPYPQFMNKIRNCYAVIVMSLGDISPNIVLDAIRLNRPFICTKEVGIFERIKNAGIFVDPLNKNEIEKAILSLLTEEGYKKAKEKIKSFNFVHAWDQIAVEFMQIFKSHGISELKASGFLKNIFNSFIAARYFICGITSAALNIIALYVFTDTLGIWYLYSSILALLISLIVSFVLQKFVVFKDMKTSRLHYQFSKFAVVLVLGTITNTVLIFIFVEWFGIWYILAQVIAGFFVMIQNFILYKFFIFNR